MSSYSTRQPSDAGYDHRSGASPHSSSSATSHGHTYALATDAYSPHAVGPPDLRISVPSSTTNASLPSTTWYHHPPPSAHYLPSPDPVASTRGWGDLGGYLAASAATGLPGAVQSSYAYQPRISSLTSPAPMPAEARFVPLHDYEARTQPASTT